MGAIIAVLPRVLKITLKIELSDITKWICVLFGLFVQLVGVLYVT